MEADGLHILVQQQRDSSGAARQPSRAGIQLGSPLVTDERPFEVAQVPLRATHELEDVAVVGLALLDDLELPEGLLVLPETRGIEGPQRQMGVGQRGVELQGPVHGLPCLGEPRLRAVRMHRVHPQVSHRQAGVGEGERRIQAHGLLVHLERDLDLLGRAQFLAAVVVVVRPQVLVVGLQVLGRLAAKRAELRRDQGDVQLLTDLPGDVGLHLEDVGEDRIVAAGPEMAVVRKPDELRRHPHLTRAYRRALPADRALQNVLHPQLLADLPHAGTLLLVLHGGGARDHPQAVERGQPAGDLFGHAVGEVLVLGRAEVLEGQHDDRRGLDAGLLPSRGPEQQPAGRHADQQEHHGRCGRPPWSPLRHGEGRYRRLGELLPPQVLQLVADVQRRLVTARGVLLQTVADDAAQVVRDVPSQRIDLLRRVLDDGGDERERRVTSERPGADGHLVEDDPEREDVRAGIQISALELLG